MQAPEKIYIADEEGCRFEKSDSEIAWNYKPPFDAVEYIHKDVFMEKADKFISSFFHQDDIELKKGILDEFHKYMKGE